MLWVPADAQTRASSSVSPLWYIPRTNICTVKRQNAPVPSRCCPSCTPSTRCSSRATTCWMRSTRTWRSWLPRWAKRLRRRSACCSISHQPHHRFIPPLRRSVRTEIGFILIWTIDRRQLRNASCEFLLPGWYFAVFSDLILGVFYLTSLLSAPNRKASLQFKPLFPPHVTVV